MPISSAELENVIREAGAIALAHFKDLKNLERTKKTPRDLVTEADVEVEAFLEKALAKLYPQYGFWGEESGQTADQSSRWIVDPIDGTHSFYKGQYFWSLSVALEINGEIVFGAVYAPALGNYYCAEKGKGARKNGLHISVSSEASLADAMVSTGFACVRAFRRENNLPRFCRIAEKTMGQRRFGSAALDLCMVADGQVDAYWEEELNLYDVAAGALIAREAGATITDFEGNDVLNPKQVLASNGKLHTQLLPLM